MSNRNTPFIIIEPIDFLGKTLEAGRVVHTSSPDNFKKQYGKKVEVWTNWPKPFEPQKKKTPTADPSQEEAGTK